MDQTQPDRDSIFALDQTERFMHGRGSSTEDCRWQVALMSLRRDRIDEESASFYLDNSGKKFTPSAQIRFRNRLIWFQPPRKETDKEDCWRGRKGASHLPSSHYCSTRSSASHPAEISLNLSLLPNPTHHHKTTQHINHYYRRNIIQPPGSSRPLHRHGRTFKELCGRLSDEARG